MDLAAWLSVILGGVTFLFSIFKFKKERDDKKGNKKNARSSLECYLEALRKELGRIGVVGPGFETITTPIQDTFTSLRIYETQYRGTDFEKRRRLLNDRFEEEIFLSPEEVMQRTFQRYRLLLIMGNPGSGKTTLLKYYATTLLDKKQDKLGFDKKEIIPIYFPLRELKFDEKQPLNLNENLSAWAKKNYMDISPNDFYSWLTNRRTLILLDGLDEIGDVERRIKVCNWVKCAWTGLDKACFVLTSRPTGFRKSDGLELECEHLQGDIMDFTPRQQEIFVKRWFKAVFLESLSKEEYKNEIKGMEMKARDRAESIINYLKREDNKSVRDLARVPMLLQIMVIIWKDRDFLPSSRSELYDVTLDYLLAYRDRRKNLYPLLTAEKARIVLAPFALWMQEKLKSDNAPIEKIHEYMQPILNTLEGQPKAEKFCQNLRDRAGLIADYGKDSYIFRHKSFMEFLAGQQLVKEYLSDPNRTVDLVSYFYNPWWEETLRFFFTRSDDSIFDSFMKHFFKSIESRHLDANKQTLLLNLVQEAPQKRIDGLVQTLMEECLNHNQVRYILYCLKTIGTPEAIRAVGTFMQDAKANKPNMEYAEDIVAEYSAVQVSTKMLGINVQLKQSPEAFRNPFEDNVEYICIPGGTYKFSVTKKLETLHDLYFCKYPVTNKLYRRFISYLRGEEKNLEDIIPVKLFAKNMLRFSKTLRCYKEYLGENHGEWHEKIRSRLDDDKKFNGDDQPVVGITWYDANFYTFWLSCLDAACGGDKELQDIKKVANLFRLPIEVEWEWATAGREEDGSLRTYPWPKSRGEPTQELANYGKNVDATTPVSRYPHGATPEGIMDMAGNVYEWMRNYYDNKKVNFALRGGSWCNSKSCLYCTSRGYVENLYSWGSNIGFRVLYSNQ